MENSSFDHYASVKEALSEAGFKVVEIEKLVDRTIITVSPKKRGDAPRLLQKNYRRHLK